MAISTGVTVGHSAGELGQRFKHNCQALCPVTGAGLKSSVLTVACSGELVHTVLCCGTGQGLYLLTWPAEAFHLPPLRLPFSPTYGLRA